jgi:hypothetical protein
VRHSAVIRLVISVVLCPVVSGCLLDADDAHDRRAVEGYVREEGGQAVPAVKITAYLVYDRDLLSAAVCSTSTDADGFYRVPYEASLAEITVRPTKAGCVFRDPQATYRSPKGLIRQDFTAACGSLASISGHILDTDGGPLVGVAITIRDELHHWDKTVIAGTGGYYVIEKVVPNLTYTVTPFYSSYTFEPPRRIYEDLNRDFEDQDFTALPASPSPASSP